MIGDLKKLWAYPENRSVASVFATLSLVFGAFITRLPEVKSKLDLSEAELGQALFFIPLGAATLLPFYSHIISKLGERLSTALAVCFLLVAMIFPWLAVNEIWLMVSFYFIGLGMGLTDVSMNAEVAEIEKQKCRMIMSSCHGFFSLGGMIGALLGSLFIWFSINLSTQMMVLAVLMLFVLIPQFKHMINAQGQKEVSKKKFGLPPWRVLIFAVIGFCIMMSEGGISEWSTIYLKDDLSVRGEYAGFGFAGFSLLMAIGRFQGDRLHLKHGAKRLVLVGSLIGILGLGLVLSESAVLGVIGFSIAGLGYSVIVPILFSTAAKQEGIPSSKSIATVASAGYIGMLLGPVLIGFIAEGFGLVNGFTFLLILTLLGLIFSLKAFR